MPTSSEQIAERYAALKDEVGPGVTVVVATKYLSVDELQVLVDAGVEVVGENRAQDLEAKHARYGDAFRWHFIGHLQSRKAKTRQRDVRAVPLARLRVGGGEAHDPGARRGEPLRRADEVGQSRRRSSARFSAATATCAA